MASIGSIVQELVTVVVLQFFLLKAVIAAPVLN